MGHVILQENYADRRVPMFADFASRYTDLPFLVTLTERDGAYVPGRFLRASDLGDDGEAARLEDRAAGLRGRVGRRPPGQHGISAHRVRCGAVEPGPRRHRPGAECAGCTGRRRECRGPAAALRCRRGRDDAPRRTGPRSGRPSGDDRVGPDARAVRGAARRPTGNVARRLRRSGPALHPGVAGIVDVGAGRIGVADRARIRPLRREIRWTFDDHHGCRHLPVVPRRRHLPRGAGPADADRQHGQERRRLGALRGPGEGAADHRVGRRWRWPPTGPGRRDRPSAPPLVHARRPVALRRLRADALASPLAEGRLAGQHTADTIAQSARMGLDAVVSAIRPQPPSTSPTTRRRRASTWATTWWTNSAVGTALRGRRCRRRGELAARTDAVAGEPARRVGERQRVLPRTSPRCGLESARRRDAGRDPPDVGAVAGRGTPAASWI